MIFLILSFLLHLFSYNCYLKKNFYLPIIRYPEIYFVHEKQANCLIVPSPPPPPPLLVFRILRWCFSYCMKQTIRFFVSLYGQGLLYVCFNLVAVDFFMVFTWSYVWPTEIPSSWILFLSRLCCSMRDYFWHYWLSKVYLAYFIPQTLHWPFPQEFLVSLGFLETTLWALRSAFNCFKPISVNRASSWCFPELKNNYEFILHFQFRG